MALTDVSGADTALREGKLLIGGEWVPARDGRTFDSINPYTGKVWRPQRRPAPLTSTPRFRRHRRP